MCAFLHSCRAGVLLPLAAAWLLLGLAEPVLAQEEPLRWGRIPDAHAALAEHPDDPDASAIVLGELGSVHFRQDMTMVFELHRRVKILTEAGYDHATVEFAYQHQDRRQTVRRLDAQSFVPDGSGLRRVSLNSNDVFREQDGSFTRVRFTLPALEPGAIIEYRYTIHTDGPYFFPDWIFQDVMPTLYSEFRAEVPRYIVFNRFPIGNPAFAVEDIREEEFRMANFRRDAGARGGSRRETFANEYRWVMTDVPALRDEDYVASMWDHAYALRFQLAGYYDRWGNFRGLAETWDDVVVSLRNSNLFGRRYRSSNSMTRQADEIVGDAVAPVDKVDRIYDHVRSSVVWDGRYRFTAERSLLRALEARRGTSGEINLLLLALLRASGIDASPVLVSTRGNGRVQTFFASASQFNHVVVRAQVGDQTLLLDATDPRRPAGMLPVAALNHDGLLVTDRHFQWVPLLPADGTMAATGFTGVIDPSGEISGSMTGRLAGYAALRARQRLDEEDRSGGEQGSAVPAAQRLTFTDFVAHGVENDGPIVLASSFRAADHAQVMGHLLTFNPILQGRIERNPFVPEVRHHPVDFTHPTAEVYEARLELPEGFDVDELPAPAESVLPGGAGVYQRVAAVDGNTLIVQRQFVLARHIFEPEDYAALRAFFEEVAAADAEVVVLVRQEGAAAPPAAELEDDQ